MFFEWELQKCSAMIQIIQLVMLVGISFMASTDCLLRMDSFVVFGQASEANLPGTAHFSDCLQPVSHRSDLGGNFPVPGLSPSATVQCEVK